MAMQFGIDPDAVGQVVNKVKLYIENEEKYIMDMISALTILQSAYQGSETKDILNEKIDFITNILYVLLENRKNYIRFLNETIDSYQNQNSYFMRGFNQMTPKLY